MQNEELIRRTIQTIQDNSEAFICVVISEDEMLIEIKGADGQVMKMIEMTTASFIREITDNVDAVADGLDQLLDDLGFGGPESYN